MDVPLVLDPQQLRRDARSGKVSVEGLLDIIDRQRQSLQRLQADNERLKQRLAQYEPAAARDNPAAAANAATPNASYSIDAEDKRRQPRRRRKKSPGRQPTEVKFAAADREVDIFPDGVPKRQCQLLRERAVWRIEDGKAIRVGYRIHAGPDGKEPRIPGVTPRCEYGIEILVVLAFLVYLIGISLDKACAVMQFFCQLPLNKSQADALLRQLATHWDEEFDTLCDLLAHAARRVVLDNLKAAVLHADWFDPELHPKMQVFAEHYGCAFLPTNPRTPRHKGKVERGIDYVQENALKGHTFTNLHDQNEHLTRWEAEVADTRVHGTTRRSPGQHFLEVEKAALLPLPSGRLASFRESQRRVHRDGHVEIEKAYYSVAPEYIGQSVWARWDGRVVRAFNMRLVQIAMHAQQLPGKFSTQDQHIVMEKIHVVEHGAEYLLVKVRRLGTACTRWAEAMLQSRGVAGVRVLQGLLCLARKNTSAALEKACSAAHAHGEYRLRTVRALLKRQDVTQPLFEFMDEHPLIRPLSDYGQFVRDALHKGGS